jgi:hypothetical protein
MTLPQPMPFFSAAANFAAGKDTPREFLERCLSHVEEFEPAVGAFVCHDIAAARAAADRSAARWRDSRPLLDPPGVRSRSQGLRVPRGSVAANSVVTTLPRITAPASRNAATLAASRPVRQPTNRGEPCSVGMSAVSMMSLMPSGMPSIGDNGPHSRGIQLLSIGACDVDDEGRTFAREIKPINRNADPKALQISGLSLEARERSDLTARRDPLRRGGRVLTPDRATQSRRERG